MRSSKILLIAASFILGTSGEHDPKKPHPCSIGLKLVAELKALDAAGKPIAGPEGKLFLEQLNNTINIIGNITGLLSGKHGIAVHETGDLSKGCPSTGHFNPFKYDHAAPNSVHRHVGDLGNIEAIENQVTEVKITDNYLTLMGTRGAFHRAIVIYQNKDDLGLERTKDSLETGSAGNGIACGVFELSEFWK